MDGGAGGRGPRPGASDESPRARGRVAQRRARWAAAPATRGGHPRRYRAPPGPAPPPPALPCWIRERRAPPGRGRAAPRRLRGERTARRPLCGEGARGPPGQPRGPPPVPAVPPPPSPAPPPAPAPRQYIELRRYHLLPGTKQRAFSAFMGDVA